LKNYFEIMKVFVLLLLMISMVFAMPRELTRSRKETEVVVEEPPKLEAKKAPSIVTTTTTAKPPPIVTQPPGE
jgi:hypothetical protein